MLCRIALRTRHTNAKTGWWGRQVGMVEEAGVTKTWSSKRHGATRQVLSAQFSIAYQLQRLVQCWYLDAGKRLAQSYAQALRMLHS